MIKINTKHGDTYKFDLDDEEQAVRLLKLMNDVGFQRIITGITLSQRYRRKYRCNKCKSVSKLVCPNCGESEDNGRFNYISQCTLTRPQSEYVNFAIDCTDKIVNKKTNGERLICNAGNTQIIITAYKRQPSSRIILTTNSMDI